MSASMRMIVYLAGTTITDKHKLEGRGLLLSHFEGGSEALKCG